MKKGCDQVSQRRAECEIDTGRHEDNHQQVLRRKGDSQCVLPERDDLMHVRGRDRRLGSGPAPLYLNVSLYKTDGRRLELTWLTSARDYYGFESFHYSFFHIVKIF